MKLIKERITRQQLKEIADRSFGFFVKAVVDIENEIMVIDAELHADEEALLIKNGSNQKNLWGINLFPENDEKDFIEFDSMINIRPSNGNRKRSIEDPKIREKIKEVVEKLVVL